MSDLTAPDSRLDTSIPHQLRNELTSLQKQLQEIQGRIAELQLDTDLEPPVGETVQTEMGRETERGRETEVEVGDQPDITLAELQKRLADRLRSLDAELKEDTP